MKRTTFWNMRLAVVAASAGLLAFSGYTQGKEPAVSEKTGTFKNIGGSGFSGWRGGIGIAFGNPGTKIPDVTELGYEVCWGSEQPKARSALDLATFTYWNGIIEIDLTYKSSKGNYDFSAREDKDEAARLAFEAWAEINYGVKGLSKYATVRHAPQGSYGNVIGKMDLSSGNPLALAVVDTQVKALTDNQIKRGGIGIDNLSVIPGGFISLLKARLNPHGLGIAVNSTPAEVRANPFIRDIDVAGAEGFPYSIECAREVRAKGFTGIFCEFVMQHMSAAELSAYLKSKLFYGIVFFGYSDGGVAASSHYTFYASRPDVYNHHRWVFRKYVPLSRALFSAGGQENPCAELSATGERIPRETEERQPLPLERSDGSGAIYEKGQLSASLQKMTGMTSETPAGIFRFGESIEDGIYYFISSPRSETVACDVHTLKLGPGTRIFDEIGERLIDGKRTGSTLLFSTAAGPGVVQLGTREVLVRNLVARMESLFLQADIQRSLEDAVKFDPLRKVWAPFCQGWALDSGTARSGRMSMKALGGKHASSNDKWRYDNRQGGAQFAVLDQKVPSPVTVCAWSKADAVPGSTFTAIENRRAHFICRETNTYAMTVYLDYQDGQWPETHTVAFAAGTHDWEQRTLTVTPKKPVRTATVLLEFQQPSGTAWFDDVSLVQENDGANALAYPGFEKGSTANGEADAIRKDYAAGVKGLRDLLKKAAGQAPVTAPDLEGIRKEAGLMEERLLKSGASPLFGRELRDLHDVRHAADVCLAILAAE